MRRLLNNELAFDIQILDNEASAEYKRAITVKWNATYQLVPPNTHRSNASERAICTFKAHFLSILAGVAPDLPRNLWDLLIPQIELTLDLLRQVTLDPSITNQKECNFQEIRTASKTSSPSKVPARVYCSWVQLERTSTWNPYTPCTYGKARTETYPILASDLQHGNHKINT